MNQYFKNKLQEKGLKVTPQRLAIFDAVVQLDNHPTADEVISFVHASHPDISVATVYKVLDTFVENDLLIRVKTDKGVMRYDQHLSSHHHLYCAETERIEDFEDPDLTQLIADYLEKNKIKNFKIQDIKLQITGTFNHQKNNKKK